MSSFILMFITTAPVLYFEHYPSWIFNTFRIPPQNQFTIRLIGWNRLAAHVEEFSKPGDIVGATDYGVTAELAFYLKGQPQVYYLPTGAVSKNAYWFFQNRKALEGKNILIVDRGNGPLNTVTSSLFSHIDKLGVFRLTDRATGVTWDTFSLYRGYDYKGE